MAKSKSKKRKKYTGPTLIDRLPKDEGEHIELMIYFTLRGVQQPPVTQFDRDMLAQADRLTKKLEKWRAENETTNQTPTP